MTRLVSTQLLLPHALLLILPLKYALLKPPTLVVRQQLLVLLLILLIVFSKKLPFLVVSKLEQPTNLV